MHDGGDGERQDVDTMDGDEDDEQVEKSVYIKILATVQSGTIQ